MISLIDAGVRLLFYYYLVAAASYVLLFLVSCVAGPKHLFRLSSVRFSALKESPFLPPVSIVIPARNEELTITESVRALLALDYPELEVIVVNDGSADLTLDSLHQSYNLRNARVLYIPEIKTGEVRGYYLSRTEPRLAVVDKESTGSKADAVNAGLNAVTGAFVCIIDADSILEKDALLRLMSAVYTDTSTVVAAGGIVRVLNGCVVRQGVVRKIMLPNRSLEILQVIEYLRAFLIGREGWAKLDMLPIISGAFGLFSTKLLREVGGLDPKSTGEDLDLVIRLHRFLRERGRGYRISFVPDPTCWTDVPRDFNSLGSQRSRWQRGLLQVLWANRDMLFRPRYGRIGFVLMPYLWVFEALEPFIETLGFVSILLSFMIGAADTPLLLQVLLLGYGFSVLVSIGAVTLEEVTYRRYPSLRDTALLIVFSFLEYFPYHQLQLWWRLKGTWQFVTGTGKWHSIKRTAFDSGAADSPITK
jgi:cellulose synthase/poly-beta-1,6-N-acetylglucosamine synthase-like glycosyltransferase